VVSPGDGSLAPSITTACCFPVHSRAGRSAELCRDKTRLRSEVGRFRSLRQEQVREPDCRRCGHRCGRRHKRRLRGVPWCPSAGEARTLGVSEVRRTARCSNSSSRSCVPRVPSSDHAVPAAHTDDARGISSAARRTEDHAHGRSKPQRCCGFSLATCMETVRVSV
jgi:hypothetical protein